METITLCKCVFLRGTTGWKKTSLKIQLLYRTVIYIYILTAGGSCCRRHCLPIVTSGKLKSTSFSVTPLPSRIDLEACFCFFLLWLSPDGRRVAPATHYFFRIKLIYIKFTVPLLPLTSRVYGRKLSGNTAPTVRTSGDNRRK